MQGAITDFTGKHVYITGGGGGLGLALATELVALGADISMATKDASKATQMIQEKLEPLRPVASQRIIAVSGGLYDPILSQRALSAAMQQIHGDAPDIVILTAGFAKPGMFLDLDANDLRKGMDGTYFTHVYTIQAAVKAMAQQRKPGHIVMISNLLSEQSHTGYSAYAPAKYAIRALVDLQQGLYDTLRPELEPLGIHVHLFMLSGGIGDNYEAEMSTKPEVTREWDRQVGYRKLDEVSEAKKILSALKQGRDGRV